MLETFRIGECFAIYAKQSRVLIVNYELLSGFFHSASPAFGGVRSELLVRRIPVPVTRNRASVDPKIDPGDHAGVIRCEKNRGASVVAPTPPSFPWVSIAE